MTYKDQDYINLLKIIHAFHEKDWVQEYLEARKKPNFWSIMEYREHESKENKKTSYEIRISRMIRWLLDPNETHQLGNAFTYRLIQLLNGENNKSSYKKISYQDTDNKVHVYNERDHIDVLYEDFSQNVYLAIEVKQYSSEGFDEEGVSQLFRYQEKVEEMAKQTGAAMAVYYIYLTANGDQPLTPEINKTEAWQPVNYQTFIDIIDDVLEEEWKDLTYKYKHDVKKIILDFKEDLQRVINILKSDNQLLTEEIQNKSKNKKLIIALGNEITGNKTIKHLEKLKKFNKENEETLEELILLINEYITSQNKEENPNVMRLTRKLFNYFADKELDEEKIHEKLSDKERTAPMKKELLQKHDLNIKEVYLTRDKGQGIHLRHENDINSIYLSGDTYGLFPNDGVHVSWPKGKKDRNKIKLSDTRRLTRKFWVSNNENEDDIIIMQDGKLEENSFPLNYIAGKEITFEQLLEDYLMPTIKELNDYIIDKYKD